MSESPRGAYLAHLKQGRLAFQVSAADSSPVFFPRVIAPSSGNPDLDWQVSEGRGTVYATTTVHRRGEAPLNVALIELDEGFRLLSRVEQIDSASVRIGLRVQVQIEQGEGEQEPFPVFVPLDGAAQEATR
ncbi:Zn-ribbon domain-containing OB-fold protein [Bradyrhizobium sp. Pha-3]|uniref:Zn-ribbon domain-containing OB-fold protein n=1 Tax=Bradyrhizobium sp. Pha-3 TaxID=208375 RepID=UPI0035D44881